MSSTAAPSAWPWSRCLRARYKVDLLRLGDLIVAAEPIGHFFGRIANFINGELWGRPTDVPWGMVFCNERLRPIRGECPAGDMPRHPSQLYEAALEGLVLFLLLRWATHRLKWLQRPRRGHRPVPGRLRPVPHPPGERARAGQLGCRTSRSA